MNSNVTDKTRKKIEYLVLKNFIIVLKQKKMYPFFRGVVGYRSRNPISSFYSRMPGFTNVLGIISSKNPFIDVGNITDMVNMMELSIPNEMNAPGEDKTMKTQLRVANCVNSLIHLFIERYVHDLKVIENIGGSIFDMTCRELLGNDFKDVLPPPPRTSRDIANLRGIPDLDEVRLQRPPINYNWDEVRLQRPPINDPSNDDDFWNLIFNENE